MTDESRSASDPTIRSTERPHSQGASHSSSNSASRANSRPSSTPNSRSGSPGVQHHRGRGHRVKFTVGGDDDLNLPKKPLPSIRLSRSQNVGERSTSGNAETPSLREAAARVAGGHSGRSHPHLLDTDLSADVTESPQPTSPLGDVAEDEDYGNIKNFAALSAQTRGQALANLMGGSHSAPGSRRNSMDSDTVSPNASPPVFKGISRSKRNPQMKNEDIPLMDLKENNKAAFYADSTDEDEIGPNPASSSERPHRSRITSEAHRLVKHWTARNELHPTNVPTEGLRSGHVTPTEERFEDWRPPPEQFKPGILSALLKLYDSSGAGAAINRNSMSTMASGGQNQHRHSSASSIHSMTPPDSSKASSGTTTPQKMKWYDKNKSPNQSTTSLSGLLNASTMMASPGASGVHPSVKAKRPDMGVRSKSSGMLQAAKERLSKPRVEDQIQITVHIAAIISRQRYIMKLCKALMMYGAPTHRLEEYLRMTARVLEIDGQFLYIPGCMIISFDDANTHTTEVKMVKANQGVDLGKLKDVHDIYKEVVHDLIGVEEAYQRLEEVLNRAQKFNKWIIVLMYGFAAACVGPFAFQARPIDMPMAFVLGCILGLLQHVVAPKSDLYSNIFEISAAVLTSFLARALGSIPRNGNRDDPIFCFSALAQSSIALILPGYTILCGSLELQSRSMVAGSVRMVYAIIYSLFLGFGITIGTVIYGLLDRNATSAYTCAASPITNDYLRLFPFVILFTLCLIIINQAKWKQAPVMLVISFAGYVVNFFSAKRFANNVQVANSLGALAIGVLGNTYSRFRHGVAAAALLPAIFVQVPSGLSSAGSLVSGLTSANQITGNATGATVINNGTAGLTEAQNQNLYTGTVFNVGYGMIQVAIGISVGLFLSALIVYPLGKKRNGWFREISDMWPGQAMTLKVNQILHHEKSKYQDVLVFESSDYGTVLVLDNVIQCTERDEFAYQEMITHLAMNSHPAPKKVLVIGGGDGGVLREVVKHESIEEAILCDIDEAVIRVSKKYLPGMSIGFQHPKSKTHIGDGFKFLADYKNEFDIIITDSSDPEGPAESLFQKPYFELLYGALKEGGVITTQGSENQWLHLSLITSLKKSCREVFPTVEYAYTTIPTYPSGQIGFMVCCKDKDRNIKEPLRKWSPEEEERLCRYYNSDIHRASFILPTFARKALR